MDSHAFLGAFALSCPLAIRLVRAAWTPGDPLSQLRAGRHLCSMAGCFAPFNQRPSWFLQGLRHPFSRHLGWLTRWPGRCSA